ncbi:MAG: fibronectin type III domain-containing protein, partial [Gammaproteobacteria bacterium]
PPTIAGTPAAGTATATYRATHPGGTRAVQTFTIETRSPPTLPAIDDMTHTVGMAVDVTLATAAGGFAPYSYAIAGDLNGLAFDAGARALTGLPRASGSFSLTYMAADSPTIAGARAMRVFMVTVTSGDFASPPVDIQATRSGGSLTVTWSAPSDSGASDLSGYKIRWKQGENAGALSAAAWNNEVGVDIAAGVTAHPIPGIAASAAYAVQLAGVNAAGAGPWSASARGIPPTLAEIDAQFTYYGIAYAFTLPQAGGGAAPYTYALRGAFPSRVSFDSDPDVRLLSGTPRTTAAPAELVYQVTDAAAATATRTFTLTALLSVLDADADGEVTAADGIMIARYALGVRGASLVDGQSAPENARMVEKNIKAVTENLKLDVNSDERVDDIDGIMIARFLLGLRGDALLKGLDGDAEKVQQNMRELQTGE